MIGYIALIKNKTVRLMATKIIVSIINTINRVQDKL